MATGVPTKKTTNHAGNGMDYMTLDYPGKSSKTHILSTPPSDIVTIWTGDVQQDRNGSRPQNHLFYGENLHILAGLLRDPRIAGHVRLVYIDPPFSTQTRFHTRKLQHAYTDTLTGSEFIEFLRKRLILLRELLADNGSIYVHIDEKMLFHVKLILDEIFGGSNYRNCITRKKCNPKNYTRNQYGNISDYLLFYSKSPQYVWNKPVEPWTEERAKEYQYIEEGTGRRFMKVPVHAPGIRQGETGKAWKGMLPPPGKHWQYTPTKLDEMDARGEIFWSANGNPRRKVYLDQNPGVSVQDIWMDFKDAHNQNIKITGYPTEKNPLLLKRIVEASSNPGDIVLDCFSGSGTTLAVADVLQRSWIGIDTSSTAIQTTLQRFVKGTEPMGDFVSMNNGNGNKTKGKSSQKPIDVLPLFKNYSDQQAVQKEKTPSRHSPITDFILCAEEERQTEFQSIAEEWLSEI